MPNEPLPKPEEIFGNDNKLPKPSEVLGETVKKKESSLENGVSQSGSKPSVSTSVSSTEIKPKPSGSSTSKPDGVYTYEGRKDAVYKKVGGKWYIDPVNTGKFVEIPASRQDRITLLEKQGKRVYGSQVDETEMVFAEKPKTFVSDKPKTKIQTEKQIAFEEDFEAKEANDPEVIAKNIQDDFMENKLDEIDQNLVGLDEKEAITKLKDIVSSMGADTEAFKFEETGAGYDAMKVTNRKTGEYTVISLDNWSDERNSNESKILKSFIDMNIKFSDLADMKYEKSALEKRKESAPADQLIGINNRLEKLNQDILT